MAVPLYLQSKRRGEERIQDFHRPGSAGHEGGIFRRSRGRHSPEGRHYMHCYAIIPSESGMMHLEGGITPILGCMMTV